MSEAAVIIKKGEGRTIKAGYLTMKSTGFPVLLKMGILLKYMILMVILWDMDSSIQNPKLR